MNRAIIDRLRGLPVIALVLAIPGQTLEAQSAQLASPPDSALSRAPSTSASDWTGFYVGAHAGVSSGSSAWSAAAPGAPNLSGSLNLFQP
jgi:hypothetical protein